MKLTTPGPVLRARHACSDVLQTLDRADGLAALIYLDPPFGTGKSFHMHDPKRPGGNGVLAYSDPEIDRGRHMAIALDRAESCKAALAPHGTVAIQTDSNCAHIYRVAFEDVMGTTAFAGEVVIRSGSRDDLPRLQSSAGITPTHNTLLFFGQAAEDNPNLPSYRQDVCQGKRPSLEGGLADTLWCHIDVRGRQTAYPTEKSASLAATLVNWLSNPAELVVEPFAGSGQVSLTALRMGRDVLLGDSSRRAAVTSGVALAAELMDQGIAGSVEIPTEPWGRWWDDADQTEAALAVDPAGEVLYVHRGPGCIDTCSSFEGAAVVVAAASGRAQRLDLSHARP